FFGKKKTSRFRRRRFLGRFSANSNHVFSDTQPLCLPTYFCRILAGTLATPFSLLSFSVFNRKKILARRTLSRFCFWAGKPVPIKSIGYFSNDTKLFSALGEALNRDEWEELRNSRLGVFIKFHKLEFGWASRLVHYMLTYQLDCKKKYELWSLIGVRQVRFSLNEFEKITGLNCEYVKNLDQPLVEVTDEMRAFWGQMGVNLEGGGVSIEELTAASIYAGFIEAQRTSTPTCASLVRLVMDLEAFEAYQWGRVAFKFLMESVKKLDLTKTYVVEGFVEILQVWIYNALPEYAAGFGDHVSGATPPLLGFLDERTDNIVKAVYVGGWVWDQTHWPVGGTKLWTNMKVEYQKVKTEGGQMETSKTSKDSNISKKERSSSPIESEEESRKKPRESPGLDMETVKAKIKLWLSGLTFTMVEGLSRFLQKKVEGVEKIVRGRGKDDCTKCGSSGDVHHEDKSVGDKDEDEKCEDEKTEDDKSKESKAEETSPQVSKPGRKRRAKSKEASPQGRYTRGNAKATGSESETGGIEPSVVVLEKEQSNIDYGSVKKLKQVGKVKAACLLASAKSDRLRRLAPSQQSPFQGNSTAKVSVLIDWLKLDPKWRQKVHGSSGFWYYTLLTPKQWLNDTHMDAGINLLRLIYTKHPEWFRSDRICLLDAVFTQVCKVTGFLDSPVNPDGSGRQPPPGALDYYTGEEPAYCRSDKTWMLEIDDIYAPLHIKGNHWVACWISIPRRHIVIWDSDVAYAKDEEIAKSVKPIAHMLPGVPQNTQSGDCGVYNLKYIECHALGMTFPAHDFCDKNVKLMRAKLAAEIFDETNINDTKKGVQESRCV
ncbi:LOW QUALITY PROTEIN: hypothetical protein N665_0018s0039, partial [Sinapis alba]